MLDGYGIHTLIWDAADERLGEWLVASPADATGRGIVASFFARVASPPRRPTPMSSTLRPLSASVKA